jgi:predicted RNase H-like HicB family nuclease
MLSAYPACFLKEENGYSVIFPDLNHLATCGDTLDEALAMAVDCLAGYLYWLQKDGDAIPEASPIEQINIAKITEELEVSPEQAFINIITVDVAEYAKTLFEISKHFPYF